MPHKRRGYSSGESAFSSSASSLDSDTTSVDLTLWASFPLSARLPALFLTLFLRDGGTIAVSTGTGTWTCTASHVVGSVVVGSVVVGSVVVGPVAWILQGTTTWTSAPAAVTLRAGDVAWTSSAPGDAAAMLILERGTGVSH